VQVAARARRRRLARVEARVGQLGGEAAVLEGRAARGQRRVEALARGVDGLPAGGALVGRQRADAAHEREQLALAPEDGLLHLVQRGASGAPSMAASARPSQRLTQAPPGAGSSGGDLGHQRPNAGSRRELGAHLAVHGQAGLRRPISCCSHAVHLGSRRVARSQRAHVALEPAVWAQAPARSTVDGRAQVLLRWPRHWPRASS
jgi:hypothetical protein